MIKFTSYIMLLRQRYIQVFHSDSIFHPLQTNDLFRSLTIVLVAIETVTPSLKSASPDPWCRLVFVQMESRPKTRIYFASAEPVMGFQKFGLTARDASIVIWANQWSTSSDIHDTIMRRWTNAGSMLAQFHTWWPNFKTTLIQYLVISGIAWTI